MVRIKRGKIAHKRRKRLLKQTKGFHWERKSKYRLAKPALFHALRHAYKHRKEKKRKIRELWEVQINAACKELGISYGQFINRLKKNKIELDRKILAELAKNYSPIFEKIIEKVKS